MLRGLFLYSFVYLVFVGYFSVHLGASILLCYTFRYQVSRKAIEAFFGELRFPLNVFFSHPDLTVFGQHFVTRDEIVSYVKNNKLAHRGEIVFAFIVVLLGIGVLAGDFYRTRSYLSGTFLLLSFITIIYLRIWNLGERILELEKSLQNHE